MGEHPQPLDRNALGLAMVAFGLVNLGVILYFADASPLWVVKGLIVAGAAFAFAAWWRLRRSGS